jgi:hypothetical protein
MDPLSSVMLRAALTWLLVGVVIGAAMFTDRALPGQWRLWMAPSHAHMLFVGWFLQFAFGRDRRAPCRYLAGPAPGGRSNRGSDATGLAHASSHGNSTTIRAGIHPADRDAA